MRLAIVLTASVVLGLAIVAFYLDWQDRTGQASFLRNLDAIAPGTPVEVAAASLGAIPKVVPLTHTLPHGCRSEPTFEAVVASERGRMVAVLYLDAERRVVCTKTFGPVTQ